MKLFDILFDRLKLQWEDETLLSTIGIALGVIIVAFAADLLVRKILLKQVHRLLGRISVSESQNRKSDIHRAIERFSRIVPAMVIWHGLRLDPTIAPDVLAVIGHLCEAFIVFTSGYAITAILSAVNTYYSRRPYAKTRPIKGYIQLLEILVIIVTTILVVSAFLGRSPSWILGGLGAIAAVLMLIFQDTILSFAASLQISSNDIVRVGDWIEMPAQGANGEVIDIALYTVRVQNWDKTISTIPTCKLISQSFKNWRGMQESGGRRIKRPIFIDQSTIRFLTEAELERFKKVRLLRDDLLAREADALQWNNQLGDFAAEPLNAKRITNLGLFRNYVQRYIEHHDRIHHGMTTMVRYLDPTPGGIPMEVYCFTNAIEWKVYESIQSEIFDHILAALPEFCLEISQNPTSVDFADCLHEFAVLRAEVKPRAVELTNA